MDARNNATIILDGIGLAIENINWNSIGNVIKNDIGLNEIN